jgi:hypothetical protein
MTEDCWEEVTDGEVGTRARESRERELREALLREERPVLA